MIEKPLILFMRVYQATLSPIFGNCCRFHPSCSNYCIAAIEKHGCLKGLAMGIGRVLRCNPLHPGGVDFVPEPRIPDGWRKSKLSVSEILRL
ncbi:MAG: membrane protein insertion efficiency factor YidD [Verrucomicrobiota bacterium]|nr:membrane protein insertion efficiency factor YidD [Verrucomicrobiota bacterium]